MLLLQSVAIIAAFVATTEGALTCPTKSGKPCVLPFSYGGKKTTECLATGSQYWCATDVKADLTMSSSAAWDYCLKDKCEDDSASTSQASTVVCNCPAIPACPVCPASPACNCPACNIYNTCPATGGGGGCTVEKGFDYYGNDIPGQSKLPVKDWAECSNLCAALNECLFWSYGPTGNQCWLKTSDSGRRVHPDHTSGNKECGGGTEAAPIRPNGGTEAAPIRPIGCKVEWGINYQGTGDIPGHTQFSVKDWAECSNLCAALNECLFWSYRSSDSKCWLKKSKNNSQFYGSVISGTKECGGE